jgi:hypothetical protein
MSAIEIKWKIWWVPTLDNVAGNANRPGLPESTARVCDRFCDEPSVAVSRRFKLEKTEVAIALAHGVAVTTRARAHDVARVSARRLTQRHRARYGKRLGFDPF